MKTHSTRQKLLSAMLSAAMVSSVGAVSCTAVTAQAASEEASAIPQAAAAEAPQISHAIKATIGNFEYSIENGQATLVKYSGSDESVTIPSSIKKKSTGETYPVVRIGAEAFKGNTKLTELSFGKKNGKQTIRYIDEKAFCDCHNLTSVDLFSEKRLAYQSDLVYIGKSAFQSCALTKIIIPDSVVYIDANAFYKGIKRSALEGDVYIGDSVYSIGDSAFLDVSRNEDDGVTGIRLGDSLRSIGREAFAGSKKLPGGAVYIPSTVTTIDMKAFKASDGCGEKQVLLNEIANVSGGYDSVIEAAYRFASGDYASYYLVSAENNKACEKYCSNRAMWDGDLGSNRPAYVVSDKMKNIASVSRTGAYVGDSVTFAGEATKTSPTGQYCYKVILKNIDTGITQSFSSQVSDLKVFYKKITVKAAGIYNVTIYSYQAEENGDKTITDKVYRKLVVSEPLQNTSSLRNTTDGVDYTAEDLEENGVVDLDLSDKFKIRTSVEGGFGEGSVSYSYVLKRKTAKKQALYYETDEDYRDSMGAAIYETSSGALASKFFSFKTSNSHYRTPGTYYLTIFARDPARRVVSSKTITLKVRMNVGQTASIEYRNLTYDQAKFDGSKPSAYFVYYRKDGGEREYVGHKNVSKDGLLGASSAKFSPAEAGKYRIYIKRTQEKDGKTIVAEDYYTVTVQ